MDPLYKSLNYLRLRNYTKCSDACKSIPTNQQKEKWYIICKARSEESWTDFTEPDDETVTDMVFDENVVANVARPGTSLRTGTLLSRGSRPITQSGRPVSGYAHTRPQSSRKISGNPTTSATSRFSRLATASLAFSGDEPDVTSINTEKFAKNPFLSRILVDYLLQRLRDPIRAIQLAASCTKICGFDDWWWKNRLGVSYYLLGLNPEAEAQFRSSLTNSIGIESRLELAKIYTRLDQPIKALSELTVGFDQFPQEIRFILAQGRIKDLLGESGNARDLWRQALQIDQSCVEAAASLGAATFYEDQPETSAKFFAYLRKLGIVNSAVLNNIAISNLSSGNFDYVGPAIVAALSIASSDEERSDVWYNISHIAITAGDMILAQQALLISTSLNSSNGEAFNNLGLIELKKKNVQKALSAFRSATEANPEMHEPWFNCALLYQRIGQLQEAYLAAEQAVKLYPTFTEGIDLLKSISAQLK
ncbi:TPR Domain containing protein [Trichomonas vaginalis G3]|uniref:TPR Domain containing protein n=1 Tax=Trichomonas vaginalis (strain ATCC PRA-98 / G3) TaxID=412133 RepID=A2EWL4_TRIV3|nr:tetratricopeptide repeat protein 8 family [Trichomonas vaginalis G3]EAY02968.1 TPR Domain containing protein [Trichomonas vaginalis G3]KAI5492191.1 tetratricopeptide repeat protein 8 family [Trichomonas vaginalis G3]|eukprot:XP_001315191.1 TPR Domain containing protein [Trichomonas vaginalis G3]